MAQGSRAVLRPRPPPAVAVRAVARLAEELRRGGRGRPLGRRAPRAPDDAPARRGEGRPRVVPPLPRQPGLEGGRGQPDLAAAGERRDGAGPRRREARRLLEGPRRALPRAVPAPPDLPLARPDRRRDAEERPEPRRPLPREPPARPRPRVEAVARARPRRRHRREPEVGPRGPLRRALQGAPLHRADPADDRVARHDQAGAPRLQPHPGPVDRPLRVHPQAAPAALPGGVRRSAPASSASSSPSRWS